VFIDGAGLNNRTNASEATWTKNGFQQLGSFAYPQNFYFDQAVSLV
jgi:hypothetical protein